MKKTLFATFLFLTTSMINLAAANNENEKFLNAVKSDSINEIKKMLKRDPQIVNHAKDKFGRTALYHAHSIKLAKLLLEAKADPNARAVYSTTPLLDVVFYGGDGVVDKVKLLLEYGADKNLKNAHGENAYHIATIWNRTKVSNVLEYGTEIPTLKNMLRHQITKEKTKIPTGYPKPLLKFHRQSKEKTKKRKYVDVMDLPK